MSVWLFAVFAIAATAVWRYMAVRAHGGTYSSGLWTLGAALLVLSALSWTGFVLLPLAAALLWLAARPAISLGT